MGVDTLWRSRSENLQALFSDVDGGIEIPNVLGFTPRAPPLPIRESQVVVLVSTFGAQLRSEGAQDLASAP